MTPMTECDTQACVGTHNSICLQIQDSCFLYIKTLNWFVSLVTYDYLKLFVRYIVLSNIHDYISFNAKQKQNLKNSFLLHYIWSILKSFETLQDHFRNYVLTIFFLQVFLMMFFKVITNFEGF